MTSSAQTSSLEKIATDTLPPQTDSKLEEFLNKFPVDETHDISDVVEYIASFQVLDIKKDAIDTCIDRIASSLSATLRFKGRHKSGSPSIDGDMLYILLLVHPKLKKWRDEIGFKFAKLSKDVQKYIMYPYEQAREIYTFELSAFTNTPPGYIITYLLQAQSRTRMHPDDKISLSRVHGLGKPVHVDTLIKYVALKALPLGLSIEIIHAFNLMGYSDPAIPYDNNRTLQSQERYERKFDYAEGDVRQKRAYVPGSRSVPPIDGWFLDYLYPDNAHNCVDFGRINPNTLGPEGGPAARNYLVHEIGPSSPEEYKAAVRAYEAAKAPNPNFKVIESREFDMMM